jgi:hypothetical protein
LTLPARPKEWVPRPFAAFAKGRGTRNLCGEGLCGAIPKRNLRPADIHAHLSATHAAGIANPMVPAASYPPFAENAKDGAPRCVGDAIEIKSLGHPPME